MRIQVEREDTNGVESGETEQNSGLAISSLCLSYTCSELKMKSHLIC